MKSTLKKTTVIAIMLATAVCGTDLYSIVRFLQAREQAILSSTSGVPGAEHLTELRAELRNLDAAMERALLDKVEGRPLDRASVDRSRHSLQLDLEGYAGHPFYAGEGQVFRTVSDRVHALDEAKTHLLHALDAGDVASALGEYNSEWRSASGTLDDAIRQLILFNLRQLQEQALRAGTAAVHSIIALLAGTVVSLVLAAAAFQLAVRAAKEREGLQAAKAREWEMFSGRVAHEVLSPLQVATLAAELAATRSEDPDVRMASVRARSALTRLKTTVDTLLVFAKSAGLPARGERTPVSPVVSGVVDDLRAFATEHSVDLICEPFPNFEVACSAGVLSIILANLLRNAIKYMGDSPLRRVQLRLVLAPQVGRFHVQDTGPGLESEVEQHLFQPFVRGRESRESGIGLGLATVKRLIEASGGRVGVKSTRGSGSEFWVELPRAAAEPARAPRLVNHRPEHA